MILSRVRDLAASVIPRQQPAPPPLPAPPPPPTPAGDGFQPRAAMAPPVALPSFWQGARTKADALAEMDPIFRPPSTEEHVTVDPAGANDSSDVDPGNPRSQQAQAQVALNTPLMQAEIASLPPEARAQAQTVWSSLAASGDPVAQLSFQKLLFSGDLPGGEALRGGQNTLEQLSNLADPNGQALHADLDRDTLVAEVVQELATPSCIQQGARSTCVATTVAIDLARTNPAEYVRLVSGLASPGGEVTLASGATLSREGGTTRDDGSNRSIPQRLLEPAFMEVANGRDSYSNSENESDTWWNPGIFDDYGGLNASQADRLLGEVYGYDFKDKGVGGGGLWGAVDGKVSRDELWDLMKEQTEDGQHISVGMDWPGGGGHKVLITGVKTVDGEDYVVFINPHGKEECWPRDELLERVHNVNWDPT